MANTIVNQSRISQFPKKQVADQSDMLLGWSNTSNLDVITPIGNLFSNANLTTLSLIVNGSITVGNSTVNLTINSTYSPGSVGGANLNPLTDGIYNVGVPTFRWGPIYSTGPIGVGNTTANVTINSSTIFLGNSTVNATLNSTSYSGLILNANNSNFLNGLPSNTFANINSPNFISSINVGSNVQISNSGLFIGNSSISVTVNSTVFSGLSLQANNANNLGGQPITYFANVTSPSFSTSINVGTDLQINTSTITVGNSTVNSSINSTSFTGTSNNSQNFGGLPPSGFANTTAPIFSTSVNVGTVSINLNSVKIGTGTINSTTFTGSANNAQFLNGVAASGYANITNPTFVASIGVGSNVNINTSVISIGTATINSTAFTGLANDSSHLGGQLPSFFANTVNPNFFATVNVGSNVQITTSTLTIGNSTVNTTINSSAINIGSFFSNQTVTTIPGSIFVNNSLGSPGQVLTTSGVGGNAYWTTPTSGGGGSANGANTQIQFNLSGAFAGDANLTWNTVTGVLGVGSSTLNATSYSGTANAALTALIANNANNLGGQPIGFFAPIIAPNFVSNVNIGANVSVNTSVLSIGNSTVNTQINSTAFSGTSNNAQNLGAIPAFNYQLNSTLASNVATMTANNSTNLGGQPISFFANTTSPNFSVSLGVGANVSVNTSSFSIGNTSVNTSINSSAISSAAVSVNNISLGNSTVNTQINSTALLLGGDLKANGGFGTSGQVLTTSGASGNVYWSTVSGGGGGGTPGGANSELQFNSSGTFGGDANLNWFTTTAVLAVGNTSVNTSINSSAISIGSLSFAGNSVLGNVVVGGITSFQNNVIPNVSATYQFGNSTQLWGNVFSTNYYSISGGNTISITGGTLLSLGNSTVNSTINSTAFTGSANNTNNLGGLPSTAYQLNSTLAPNVATMTANNSLFLGGLAASGFANTSAPIFTNSIHVGANVAVNTSALSIGNSTVNTTINSTMLTALTNIAALISLVGPTSNVTINSTAIFIGNSTVNAIINSTSSGGGGGDASTLQGHPASYFANVTSPNFASFITVGNSTVNTSVNSSIFSGTANNATNLNGIAAASYQLNSTLAANVATLNANNSTYFNGQLSTFYANTTAPNFSVTANVGANLQINTSALFVGNSTVNSTINSTAFSGTANNSLFLGGLAASGFANTSAPVISGSLDVGANVIINTSALFVGNSTVNTIITSSNISTNSALYTTNTIVGSAIAGVFTNSTIISVGNSTVNSSINSTSFSGVANNSLFLGGLAASGFANTSTPIISGTISVGSNVVVNTSVLSIGNSTVNSTVNSTIFTGTSNNANNLGGLPPTSYANNSAPIISTSVAIGANVVANTSTITVGNTSISSILTTLGGQLKANNAVGTSGQALLSGGVGNVYWGTVSGGAGNPGGANTQIQFNNSGVFGGNANFIWNNTLGSLSIGNSTVNSSINSTAFSIIDTVSNTSINSTFVVVPNLTVNGNTIINGSVIGGPGNITLQGDILPTLDTSYSLGQFGNTWQAYLVNATFGNSTVSSFINATFFDIPNIFNANGSNGTSGQVLTSGGVGNVYWSTVSSGGGTPGGANTQIQFNNSGVFGGDANLNWVSTGGLLTIGNSTVNSSINSSMANFTTATIGSSVSTANHVVANSTSVSVGNSTVNTVINATSIVSSGAAVPSIALGNSTVNTVINSTAIDVNQFVANAASLGTSGQALLSGGTTGNVYWGTVSGGSGTPGGANTQIQFNNSGVFGGDANLSWQSPLTLLTIGNSSVNTQINSISLRMGNSTVNSSINSSTFVVNTNSVAQLSVNGAGGTTTINSSGIFTGNATVNASINSTTFTVNTNSIAFLTVAGLTSNGTLNATALYIGNSTLSSLINSSSITISQFNANGSNGTSGQVLTSGATGNLYWSTISGGSGTPGGANTQIQFNNSGVFGGDANLNWISTSATLKVGNSTVNTQINSTAFSGTSNNTLFVGSASAANVVSNAQLASNLAGYQTTSGLAAAVAVLPSNAASFIGTLAAASVANNSAPIISTSLEVGATTNNVTISTTTVTLGNSTIFSTVNSTIFTGTSNNATNFAGSPASSYQTIAGLASNVALLTSNNSTFFNGQAVTYYANITSPSFGISVAVGANVVANTSVLSIGNSTVNTQINSTTFSTVGVVSPSISVGNTTVNTQINSTSFAASATANGYMHYPNGLISQWGRITTANTTSQAITFPTAFGTNAFSIQFTGLATNTVFDILTINATAMTVNCGSATAVTGMWHAIGI